jgi:hypothetical protein
VVGDGKWKEETPLTLPGMAVNAEIFGKLGLQRYLLV